MISISHSKSIIAMVILGLIIIGGSVALSFRTNQKISRNTVSNGKDTPQTSTNPLPFQKFSCLISAPTKPYSQTSTTENQVHIIDGANGICTLTVMGCENDLCSEGKVDLECGVEVNLCNDDVFCRCK